MKNTYGIETDLELRKVQNACFEILKKFRNVCEENGLRYYLGYGSLLGAVRHHGYIPWDDDADIFMTRADYDRFLELFDSQLGDKYVLHCPERNPELGSTAIQIIKKETVFKTIATAFSEEDGVFMDIFILENAPNSKILRNIHGFFCMFFGLCLSCARYHTFEGKLLEIYKDTNEEIIKNIKTKSRIGKVLSFINIEKWVYITNKMYSLCKNNMSKYVVCPTGMKYYFGEIFERSEYCTTTDILFEGHDVKIIRDYDVALKRLYGNYMKIPPKEKREKHVALKMNI